MKFNKKDLISSTIDVLINPGNHSSKYKTLNIKQEIIDKTKPRRNTEDFYGEGLTSEIGTSHGSLRKFQ